MQASITATTAERALAAATSVRKRAVRALMVALPACALLLSGPSADAANSSNAAVSSDTLRASAQVCASCHGQAGTPQSPATPVIWGQQADYLKKQLSDYKNGDRDSQIMSSIAGSLSEAEISGIAAYFAAATWPATTATATTVTVTPTSAPAAIATCQACHQAALTGGVSPAGFAPRLAGQSAVYLDSTMRAYASGERANNETMSALMKSLTAADMHSLAAYLSSLH